MRVTLNLGMFFHDHRSVARIFINGENMKCIEHLQEHISNIFKIEKFYLKCENQYLPPEEDVNVLNSGDVLWAIPITDEHGENSAVENDHVHKLKKKKKKKDETTVDESYSSPKKRKHACEDSAEKCFDSGKKRKRTDKHREESSENVTSHIPESYCTENGEDSAVENDQVLKIEKKKVNSENGEDSAVENDQVLKKKKVKSLINKFETKKISFNKQLPAYNNIMENEKKINIVKTIIVTNNKPSSSLTSNDTETTKEEQITPKQKVEELGTVKSLPACNFMENHKKINIIKTIIVAKPSSSSISNDNEQATPVENCENEKRKRKRVRKRKRANKGPVEFDESSNSICSSTPCTPLIPQAAVSRHVRFDDDFKASENDVFENNPQTVAPKNEPSNYCCKLIPTPLLNKKLNGDVNCKNDFSASEQVSKDSPEIAVENLDPIMSEEFILKQPIISKNPSAGDIIAFKVLRISENYTPEVSSRILGKVHEYSTETAEVAIDIIEGREQCMEPKGKFSLEEDQIVEETDNKYRCSWSNLLEPRLLFP